MRTYEELLAAQTELMHFNKYHDPKTGQFASKNGGSSHHPLKDKPGSLEEAREKGVVGNATSIPLSKREKKALRLYASAKDAYNRTANALTYLTSDDKKTRGNAARAATTLYDTAETTKKILEKTIAKINKDGHNISIKSLEPQSVVLGRAFIKRNMAQQIGYMLNPFAPASGSITYKLDKEKAQQLGQEYRDYIEKISSQDLSR